VKKNFGTVIVAWGGSPHINISNSQLTSLEISRDVEGAIVNVTNSQIRDLGLWIHDGVIKDLRTGHIKDLSLSSTNFNLRLFDVSITNSVILWVSYSSNVVLQDSSVFQVHVRKNSKLQISNSSIAELSLVCEEGIFQLYNLYLLDMSKSLK